MSEGRLSGCASGVQRYESGSAILLSAADWLSLAAAPAFAFMGLLTGVLGSGGSDMLCSTALDALPLNGMVLMYALMSAFHLSPWLKLISSRVQLYVAAEDDCVMGATAKRSR
ncbi:hypothetical protein [Pseudorhodoplanes sinuspersici]|uniref:hypothetical protein n=1 Tax=Pseudorhodoplanes sinuspersici TaxID=1235591 RepID=UPI000FED8C15|nr:hypothetical protein [Pseudorhodoplanes sinuspersici]RKE74014.1 hypothetical protein DFP91_1913 [Pseudorhodoplanes sinuspersici]